MNDVPFTPLRHFYFVAKLGGFTRASTVLRVRQPSISKMVKQLEDEFGAQLLERHKRGVTLTPLGKEVYRRCERIADELTNVRSILDRDRGECAGELRIGVADHIASELLPAVVALVRERHPRLVLRLIVAPSHQVCRDVAEGEKELGLLLTVAPDPNLDEQTLLAIPHRVVIATRCRNDRAVRASFIGSRELDDEANRAFPTLDMLRRHQPETRITVSCNNHATHLRLVLEGVGVAILPELMIAADLRSKRLTVLHPDYQFIGELKFVSRKNRVASRNAEGFLACFRDVHGGRPPRRRRKARR